MSAPRYDSAAQRRPMRPLAAAIVMSRRPQASHSPGLIVAQAVHAVMCLKGVWHLLTASDRLTTHSGHEHFHELAAKRPLHKVAITHPVSTPMKAPH